MKNPNPLESYIEEKVCLYAKVNGILVYKFTSMGKRSVPDRLLILPGGAHFYIEFKRRGEHPTSAQRLEISKLQKQGATVYVCDNVEEGKRAVDSEISRSRVFDDAHMNLLMDKHPMSDPMF